MKKLLLMLMLLCTSFLGAWAGSTEYTDHEVVGDNGTARFSCYKLSGNTYCLKFVAQGDMKFTSAYNMNLGVNQTGGAGIGLGNAVWEFSDDKSTAYAVFETASETSLPTGFFGNYLCFGKTGGTGDLVTFSEFNPGDIDWTVTSTDVEVLGISLPASSSVKVGESITLKPSFNPVNTTERNVTWETDASGVATVTNGVVTGVSTGTANITVKTENNSFSATCAVTVKDDAKPTSAPAAPTYPSSQVKAIYSPTYNANTWNFQEWASGSTSPSSTYGKAVKTSGTGKWFGLLFDMLDCSAMEKLHLDVWCPDNVFFRVVPIIQDENGTQVGGDGEQGSATQNATAGEWVSLDIDLSSIAYTYWGKVIQLKIDQISAETTLYFDNIYFYTTKGATPVLVNSITISAEGDANEITVGNTLQLSAEVLPADADNKAVTWSSSANGIATVADDGTVTGIAAGNVTITATAKDGSAIYDTYDITVNAAPIVATATASSSENAVNTPDKAIDNDENTRWASAQTANENWTVNYGSQKTFNTVEIVWEGAYAKSFNIYGSNNGESWTLIKSITNQTLAGFPNTQQYNVGEQTYQYVKFEGIERGTEYGYSFYEFRTKTVASIAVTGITVTGSATEVAQGGTLQLTANVTPDNADNKTVTWSTTGNAGVTVNATTGLVTVAADATIGSTATITATATDGSNVTSGPYTITVTEAAPIQYNVTGDVSGDNFDISYSAILRYNGDVQITITDFDNKNVRDGVVKEICPNSATYYGFDGNDIATVGGPYTQGATFSGFFWIKYAGGVDNIPVTFTLPAATPQIHVTDITLDKTEIEIREGNTADINVTFDPEKTDDKEITWTSSDNEVATVVNGKVTAVKASATPVTITATTHDGGISKTCQVTVLEPIAVTGVTLDRSKAELYTTTQTTLVATVAPDDAANKTVTWSTNNDAVATVVNGVVTAVAAGNATITATTADGSFTATCDIIVKEPARPTKANPATVEMSDCGLKMTYYVSNDAGKPTIHFVNYENTRGVTGMVIADTYPLKTLDQTPDAGSVVSTTYHFASTLGDHWVPLVFYMPEADTQAPTQPVVVAGSVKPGVNNISFTVTSTDNSGDLMYEVYDEGDNLLLKSSLFGTGVKAGLNAIGLTANSAHTLTVYAVDATGNKSVGTTVSATTVTGTELFTEDVKTNAYVDHTFFMTGNRWADQAVVEETQSSATYDKINGTLTANIIPSKTEQWHGQVFLNTGITYTKGNEYDLSFTVTSTKELKGLTVKLDDKAGIVFDTNAQVGGKVSENNYVYTFHAVNYPNTQGAGNGLMVFDFAPCDANTDITISNISIIEHDATNPISFSGTNKTDVIPVGTFADNLANDKYEDYKKDKEGYKLVWKDDFEDDDLHTTHWTIEDNGDGGGNNELQYYSAAGVSVQNGNLALTAMRKPYGGKEFLSGRVNSMGKLSFKYGKVEARIKLPKLANGLWPAYWMMGNDFPAVGWPACGELDILEMGNVGGINAGTQEKFLNGAIHYGAPGTHKQVATGADDSVWDGQNGKGTSPSTWGTDLTDDYHIFTMDWQEDRVFCYIDNDPNKIYFDVKLDADKAEYFNSHSYLLFNLAIGGDFTGIHDPNNITAIGAAEGDYQSMFIDYVRVWQLDDNVVENDPTAQITVTNGRPYFDDQRYYVFDLGQTTMDDKTKTGDLYNGLGTKEVIDLRPDEHAYEKQLYQENYGDKNMVFVENATRQASQADIYTHVGESTALDANSTWGGLAYNLNFKTDLSGIDRNYKFHIDVKTNIKQDINVTLKGAGAATITIPYKKDGVGGYDLSDGQWHSVDIPLIMFYTKGLFYDDATAVSGSAVILGTGGNKEANEYFDYSGIYIHGPATESEGYVLRPEKRLLTKDESTKLFLTDLDGNNVQADSWEVTPAAGVVSGTRGNYKYTVNNAIPVTVTAIIGDKKVMTNLDAWLEADLDGVKVSTDKPEFGPYKYHVLQLDDVTFSANTNEKDLQKIATSVVDLRNDVGVGGWSADWNANIPIISAVTPTLTKNIYNVDYAYVTDKHSFETFAVDPGENWDWGGISTIAKAAEGVDLSGITDDYTLHIDIATNKPGNMALTVSGLGSGVVNLGMPGSTSDQDIEFARTNQWYAIDIPMSVFNSQGMTFAGVEKYLGTIIDLNAGDLRNNEVSIGGIYFYGPEEHVAPEPTVKHEITDITNTTAVLNIPAQENATEVKVVYTWVKPNVQPTEGKTFETETHTQISTTTAGQPYYMPLYNLQPNTTHTVEVWYGDQKQENLTFETLIHQPNTAPAAARGELMEEEPIPFIDFEPNWQYQDVTNYEGKDNDGVYSFTMPSATYEQWQAQFRKNLKFINTDTDPDPEQVASIYDEYNYNLSFTVKSSEKVPLTASIESSETAWRNKDGMTSIIKYNFGVLETPNTGADKDKYPYIHTYTVQNYPGKDIPGAILVIDFGKNTAGTTVEISNISVEEIAKNDGPVVINGKEYDLKAETTGATNTTVTLGITTEGVAGQHVIYTITAQKKGDTNGKVYTWTTSGVGDKPTSFVASGLDKGTTYVFNVKAQLEDDTYVGPSTGRDVEGTTLDYDLTMSGILYAKNMDPQDGTTDNNTVGNAVNHTNNQNSTAHDEVDAADDFIPTVPFSRGDNVGKTINEWPYTIGYSVKKNDDGSLTITGGIDSESAKIQEMCNPTLWFTNTGEGSYQWMFDRVDAGATGSPDAFVYTVPETHPAAQNYNPDVTRIDYRFPFTSGGFINSGYVSAKVVRGDLTLKAGVVQTTERTATIYMNGQNGTSETVTYNIYKGAYNSVSDAENSSNLVATTTGTAGQNTNYIFTGLYPDTQYEYTVVVTDGADRKAIQVVRPRTLPLGLGEVEFDNTVDGSAKYVWLNGTDQNNRQTVDYTYSFNLNYNTDGSLTMIGGVGPQGDNTKSVSDAVGLVLPHVYIKKINESTWTDVQAPAGKPTEFYYTTTAPGPYAKGDVVEVKVKYEYNGLNGESQFTTPTMRFIVMSDEQNAPAYHFFDEDHTTLDQYIGTSKRVRIERSIKAGHWNSFCVPFDVKKSLLVQSIVHNQKENITLSIHKLDGLSVTGNNSYTMKFAQLDKEVDDVKLECGKPYLVKIAVAKDDFTPSDVDDPKADAAISAFDLVDVDEPIALNTFAPEAFTCKDEYDQTKTISFLPGYTAVIAPNYVPYGAYFINRSEIRYVDNPVQMLGFRGYFYTDKGLKSKTSSDGSDANPDQGAKMNVNYMFIEDDIDEGVMTGVDLNNVAIDFNQPVYNINGQRVSNSTKGILIQNGRKFVNK